jgi:hypothetical protein
MASVGTPPANNDFETGDFTAWTTANNVTIQSDTPHGYYAQLSGANAEIVSSAFTVDSAAQAFTFDAQWISSTSYAGVKVYVLSGTGYTTQTEILSAYCFQCGSWTLLTPGAGAWLGQSIKLKFVRFLGDVGIDNVQMQEVFPAMTPAGAFSRKLESGNTFVELGLNGTLTSEAFTVASDAQLGTVDLTGRSTLGDQYIIQVLHGAGYATATTVASGTVADSWTAIQYELAEWQGQSIKLVVKRGYGTLAADNIGYQLVELPGWQLDAAAEIERVESGGEHYVRLAWGDLTTDAFTVDVAAQADHPGVPSGERRQSVQYPSPARHQLQPGNAA